MVQKVIAHFKALFCLNRLSFSNGADLYKISIEMNELKGVCFFNSGQLDIKKHFPIFQLYLPDTHTQILQLFC